MKDTDEPAWVDRSAWSAQSRWVDVGPGRLRVADVGEGPVVLFSHGTPTWSFEWRHVLADLSRDHRCVAPDHLGFGRSDRPKGADYGPKAHAERFRAMAEALDLRDIALVVHDYGGPFALPLALDTDRVSRIVLINTFSWPLDGDRRLAAGARLLGSGAGKLAYRWLNASLRIITPSAYGDRRKLTDAIFAQYLAPFEDRDARVEVLWPLAEALLGASDWYAGLWARRAKLAELPSALVWGTADTAFGPPFLARWREALPDAAVTEIAGAGHWPHEEEPKAVIAAIRGALAQDAPPMREAARSGAGPAS